ncbi:tRNA dimethylallyltransferase 2-like [Dysidea avara]|uniref:tRNA dimethylallyltransferase 2-like n=1 Tax=Dysidea avara TaxID=196820 RepID=UPI003326AF19
MSCSAVKARPRVLVIAGSTAVGKTELSLHLAQRLNGEIISADSAQVYQEMNIGTAKVAADVSVPHHLVNIVPVTHSYAAGEFRKDALKAIEAILSRGRTPIVVGGTGFYVNTLLSGESTAPASTAEDKQHVNQLIASKTWDQSLELLKSCDPQYASSLNGNDWYRLRRALEVYHQTGKPVSTFKPDVADELLPYNYKCLFLTMPRALLYQRIDTRCTQMIKEGLLQETIMLVKRHGLVADSSAGRSLGYRQVLEFLQQVWSFLGSAQSSYQAKMSGKELQAKFCEFFADFQTKTRNFAKDQLIYFRPRESFHWINVAPGNHRLPMETLADVVTNWFIHDHSIPQDIDGTSLKQLTKNEQQELLKYKSTEPFTTNEIDVVLDQIQHDLNQLHN